MRTNGKSIQVWVVRISAHKRDAWHSVLSDSERERAARFRMPADQDRFTVTRGILKTLLAGYLHLPRAAIEFTANEHGKPAVSGANVQFNVSHSGDYALLAFAEDVDVGIDVEKIAGDRVVGDLARRVLSAAEFERFNSLVESEREKRFFQIWTLKESLLKAIGSGLSVGPERIEVAFYPAGPKLMSSAATQIPDVDEWTLRTLAIGDDGYAAAIAVRERMPVIEIKHFA